GQWPLPGLFRRAVRELQPDLRLRRESRRARDREIWPANRVYRGRRPARHRVSRDGVVLGLGRDIARDPGPDWSGPGLRGLSEYAQREDFVRVPSDRDLDGAAGDSRILRAPGAPRRLRDRRLGIAVRRVGAGRALRGRLRVTAAAAGAARAAPAPGRRVERVTRAFGSLRLPRLRPGAAHIAQRLSYSSWRRHQPPVSLPPLGAGSSH